MRYYMRFLVEMDAGCGVGYHGTDCNGLAIADRVEKAVISLLIPEHTHRGSLLKQSVLDCQALFHCTPVL